MKRDAAASAAVTLPYNDFKALMENQVTEDFDAEQAMLVKNCAYIDALVGEVVSGEMPIEEAKGFEFFKSKTGRTLLSLLAAHQNQELGTVERYEAIDKILSEVKP